MRNGRPIMIGVAIAALVLGFVTGIGAFIQTLRYGFSTHDQPTAIEAFLAGRLRNWSVSADLRHAQNPVPLTPEILAEARAHFADHCAICHGNDGKGKTEMGQDLYPRPPDMTLPDTQSQSDGELFAAIENGVRLTGMPGWGNGTAESRRASWTLVHFIRHLPKITPQELQEMKAMNPISPMEMEESKQERKEEERFLEGVDRSDASSPVTQLHAH